MLSLPRLVFRTARTAAPQRRPTESSPLGLSTVPAYAGSTGGGSGSTGRDHALPVLRRRAGRASVLLRPVCGTTGPQDLQPYDDWRELPAVRQCAACHDVVTGDPRAA